MSKLSPRFHPKITFDHVTEKGMIEVRIYDYKGFLVYKVGFQDNVSAIDAIRIVSSVANATEMYDLGISDHVDKK